MIRSAVYLTALTLVPGSLAAQNESVLRIKLEGRLVAPRLDMPATKGGVNVYPHRRAPLDTRAVERDVARYGVGVPAGRAARVTRIKVKGKHIEFQLGKGGARQEPKTTSSYVGKSREERRLEDEVKKTDDKELKERLEDQLRDLQDRRRREQERLDALDRIEHDLKLSARKPEDWALMAGARFNVRFDSKVPPEALTPEGLMDMLARWVDFDPPAEAEGGTAKVATGKLRKGMTEAEVDLEYGMPLGCEDSRAGDLDMRTCRWTLPDGHLEAQFVQGVLVKYTFSSESP